ncbi:metallophosphoesterase [bacterium]|nr:metallophosphoesterase [bacterium]
MPRILITADVHLGITTLPRVLKLITDIRAERPDAIAIAGDIGEGVENIEIVLEEFASIGIPVAACAGNHDVWNYDKKHPSEKLWGKTLPEIAKKAGVTWLDNENLIVGDVAIIGSIAWYDYSAQDPAYKVSGEETWKRKREFDADAWQVDWPWNDIEFCRMIEPGFRYRLEKAQSDEKVREIVVVTHSPIFEGQIKRKPGNIKWGFSNAYYGNLTFGKIAGECGKVTHAIAGHTHSGMEGITEISGHPARVVTLNSQYNEPLYLVLDLADS